MTTTTTRLTAWVTTEGQPELLILTQHVDDLGTDDEYIAGLDDEPVVRRPLTIDADGRLVEDYDAMLVAMGYRAVGKWEPTPDGGVVVVERMW